MQREPRDNGPTIPAGGGAQPVDVQTHFAWLRTRMAGERTLMSWNRTSLSVISFGFSIYKFFDAFQQATAGTTPVPPEGPRNVGLAMVLVGTVGTLIMTLQYLDGLHYLQGDEFKAIAAREGRSHIALTLFVAVFSAAIGIGATVWILKGG